MSRPARQKALRRGHWAERLAALALRLKGYRVVERNWRVGVGEVDIIARKGRTLAFVEVKRRRGIDDALLAVTARQRQRIGQAARAYLAAHPACANMHVRFDVIAIVPARWPLHCQAAWGME